MISTGRSNREVKCNLMPSIIIYTVGIGNSSLFCILEQVDESVIEYCIAILYSINCERIHQSCTNPMHSSIISPHYIIEVWIELIQDGRIRSQLIKYKISIQYPLTNSSTLSRT